jgi:predicted peroxiredoxin
MSGAEAIVVFGSIASIITIIDEIKKIYDTATNARGLPTAFCEVAGCLPIIENILESAKEHINQRGTDEALCKGVKVTIQACEEKAKVLEELFQNVFSEDGASGKERYRKAVKSFGKGHAVENLMKGMLEDVQLLVCESGMKTANKTQKEQIAQAIVEVSALESSVPERIFQDQAFSPANHGSGPQYNAQGEYIFQGHAPQYNAPGGTMNFGKD